MEEVGAQGRGQARLAGDGEIGSGPEAIEQRLARFPDVAVPTITMEGEANGAPHPDPKNYAKKFLKKYEHRHLAGGIGHNLPQEAPREFAQAILDVAKWI